MSDLLHLSATQLAARIRSGEVSSAVVVEAHIERLRQVNPIINAVVVERNADARVEAANADREIAAARAAGTLDQLPPFLGVPCTSKKASILQACLIPRVWSAAWA